MRKRTVSLFHDVGSVRASSDVRRTVYYSYNMDSGRVRYLFLPPISTHTCVFYDNRIRGIIELALARNFGDSPSRRWSRQNSVRLVAGRVVPVRFPTPPALLSFQYKWVTQNSVPLTNVPFSASLSLKASVLNTTETIWYQMVPVVLKPVYLFFALSPQGSRCAW